MFVCFHHKRNGNWKPLNLDAVWRSSASEDSETDMCYRRLAVFYGGGGEECESKKINRIPPNALLVFFF